LVSHKAKDLFDLAGKTAVVTGSLGYIGTLIVETLATNGARVILLGRGRKLDKAILQLKNMFGNGNIDGKKVDMSDLDSYELVLKEIAKEEEDLEIIINNAYPMNRDAGFNQPKLSLENANRKHWEINLQGGIIWSVMSTQILGSKLIERQAGSIINISSMYGIVAPDMKLYQETEFMNPPGYSVAKSGMLGLTRYTASTWGKHGIRANAILPGPFPNIAGKSDNAVQKSDNEFINRLMQRTCLNRYGKVNELAGPVLFLASEASSYVTGISLCVDGGWTII